MQTYTIPATATIADLARAYLVEIGPAFTLDNPFFEDEVDGLQGRVTGLTADGDAEVVCDTADGVRVVYVAATRLIIVNPVTGKRSALRALPPKYVA